MTDDSKPVSLSRSADLVPAMPPAPTDPQVEREAHMATALLLVQVGRERDRLQAALDEIMDAARTAPYGMSSGQAALRAIERQRTLLEQPDA